METPKLTGNILVLGQQGKTAIVKDYLTQYGSQFKEILCVAPYNDYSDSVPASSILKGFNMAKINSFICNLKTLRKTESKPEPRLLVLDLNSKYCHTLKHIWMNADYLNLTFILTSDRTHFPLNMRSQVDYLVMSNIKTEKLAKLWVDYGSCSSDLPDYSSFRDTISKSNQAQVLDRKNSNVFSYNFAPVGTMSWLLHKIW